VEKRCIWHNEGNVFVRNRVTMRLSRCPQVAQSTVKGVFNKRDLTTGSRGSWNATKNLHDSHVARGEIRPTFLTALAAFSLQFSLKFMLRSRYRWLLFIKSAGGSIGGGFASFLCLKRLSVLSCLVRSTSTTFRSSIFNSIQESLNRRVPQIYLPFRNTHDVRLNWFFVTLHHES